MPVNFNAAVVDDVVSVLVKLPKEVREKVIEATNQLLTVSKRFGEDTTDAEISGVMDELFLTLPAEVQRGVLDTLKAIITNIEE